MHQRIATPDRRLATVTQADHPATLNLSPGVTMDWLYSPSADHFRVAALAGYRRHEAFLDHHRILVDDRHLDVSRFAF